MSEVPLYVRLIDSCITQIKAQGPPTICYESQEEEMSRERGGRTRDVEGQGSLLRATCFLRCLLSPKTLVYEEDSLENFSIRG